MTLQPDPREMYAFMDPAEDLARARKHELVSEVKRLIDLVAHIDVERADRDELAQLADDAAALADRLEPLPSLLEVGGMAAQQGPQGALLERSGISGRANPLAPPMQWHPDGDILRGWATYSPAYEGPIGHVHGGFVAAAFDDLMGMAQMASGIAGYTGTLTVKMLRPTPLEQADRLRSRRRPRRRPEDLRLGQVPRRRHAAGRGARSCSSRRRAGIARVTALGSLALGAGRSSRSAWCSSCESVDATPSVP